MLENPCDQGKELDPIPDDRPGLTALFSRSLRSKSYTFQCIRCNAFELLVDEKFSLKPSCES